MWTTRPALLALSAAMLVIGLLIDGSHCYAPGFHPTVLDRLTDCRVLDAAVGCAAIALGIGSIAARSLYTLAATTLVVIAIALAVGP